MKPKWDHYYLDLAKQVSLGSKDPSTQAGAVIAGPRHEVISVGFNGFPQGMPDLPELYENREEKYSRIIHCEMNALIFANRMIPEGSTLYTYPIMSCDRCVVHMLQAGIRRFVAPPETPYHAQRWGPAFTRTRTYIQECGGELIIL